jgi:RND family efflux transporter MFP subunit
LGAAGHAARERNRAQRDAVAETRDRRPRVLVAKAERSPTVVEQVLPASATPERETAVYARTSGYLKRWLVDVGDSVKDGQLLAEIESPEVDAQLQQARATLLQIRATLLRDRANESLAQVNLERARQLLRTSAASKQDYDTADATLKVAAATVQVSQASIRANEAAVKRLEDLQSFQKVTAPFAGVITARNFDPGALVVADNASAKEMFHVAHVDTLRVLADVPQSLAPAVKVGRAAQVFRREAPGREFTGKVARTSRSVDPQTRTLRVEVEVPNSDSALISGMYLQIRFRFDVGVSSVRIPGAAVIIRAEGTRVAVLDANNAVRYRNVRLGRDLGNVIEVITGLSGDETVVVRPGDDLTEGTVVEPVTPAKA